MSRDKFYEICVQKNIVDTSAKILVLGAGIKDESIFKKLKFKNVTYSNYNSSGQNDKYINNILLQDIKLEDESYDYCVAHACIHHSSKPHNSILEMHRVAKKGILVIEANDCLTTRIACRLNYAEEFEKTAVINNNLSGGVDNSDIPNFVYRWTEREVYKLISSYRPQIKHKIKFYYGNDVKFFRNFFLKFLFMIFFKVFKKQQNLFAFYIDKVN